MGGVQGLPAALPEKAVFIFLRVRFIVLVTLVLCITAARQAQAQSAKRAPSEADSAAVLSIVVDELLRIDSLSDPVKPYDPAKPYEWKDPEGSLEHLRVIVRIAKMPYGAWANPSIARLHAWRWRYNGWVIDSTQSVHDFTGHLWRPNPVTLHLRIAFEGDLAGVEASWAPSCEVYRHGMLPIEFTEYLLTRSPAGWRLSRGQEEGGVADAIC